ncbi:MAG TPA: diguanylate cyclase, partial [Nevskiaceae bacterium]|nr:diguanylate cyclase [Nevskiaceae bacterium]
CRRIVQKFETPVPYGGQFIKTSPSIGVATYPDHGDTEERLFKSADIALYAAKRGGRNTWRWFGGASSEAAA